MAYFLVLAKDRAEAHEARLAHRQDHLDYWNGQMAQVKVAGAMLDGDRPMGSAFLIEAADEAEAQALLTADPFTTAGIFSANVQIIAMRPAIGDWLP